MGAGIAAIGAIWLAPTLPAGGVSNADAAARDSMPTLSFVAEVAREALGRSGNVKVETALPGGSVTYPLLVGGDVSGLFYQWVGVADSVPIGPILSLAGPELRAPDEAGFYRLSLMRDSVRRLLDDLTLAVMVPFADKRGSRLNGYLLGSWRSDAPDGFVQISEKDLDLPLSKHVRLRDFLSHDGQRAWPRYVAVDQRLLDKLELVLQQLDDWASPGHRVTVDVNAGFRSPSYNRRVAGAANSSRHQHGDAIDVAIDANGDGRVSLADVVLVQKAVDAVERDNPDLTGGLGVYTSGNFRRPFVHIDTRGHRARWRG
ncbi:MAG TPA: D-Ala-D-Ala carboxypeptidase family metallohydrolase [Gemmatimonadales bacterium]|nr:D-Ala-D-Ala carboxypeptidase family metallohydrolase [Gemmatimonadales bacterium]